MANSFVDAERYVPVLDEIYKANAKTAILESRSLDMDNTGAVKIYKTSMDGLGNYDRANGFAAGDVTGVWETITLTQDRSREFEIDYLDNDEVMGMAFGTLVSEFMRTKVVPEVDAYRFAKIAGTTGITKATPVDVTVGTTIVPDLIDEAERQMNEDEVPTDGRILFISETAYAGLRNKVTREVMNGEKNINNGILYYNDMQIIRVPQNRFYTAVTMYDGKQSGQKVGGYVPTSGGYKMNFMIVHPSAVWQCLKHVAPRIFAPNVNQHKDAYKFQYRMHHDIGVYDNKVKGIYINHGSTAV